MYTRVFSSILDSSIWQEELHVRVLWLALLIIADENRDGTVNVPISRLAQKAVLTEEQTRAALKILMSPDTESDSPDEDGRRIVPLIPERPERGWKLVNWQKYKDIANAEHRREQVAENMRRYRAKSRSDQALSDGDQTVIPSKATPTSTSDSGKSLFADAHEKTSSKKRTRVSAKEKVENYIAAGLSQKMVLYAKKYGVDASEAWDIWVLHIRGNDYRVGRNPCGDPESAFMYWMRTDAKRKKENASRFQQPATRHIARAPEPGKENW